MPAQVRQALKTLQNLVRQRPTVDATIVKTITDRREEPPIELRLTAEQVTALKAAEEAIAADLRFEHLVPAEDLLLKFAADCRERGQAGCSAVPELVAGTQGRVQGREIRAFEHWADAASSAADAGGADLPEFLADRLGQLAHHGPGGLDTGLSEDQEGRRDRHGGARGPRGSHEPRPGLCLSPFPAVVLPGCRCASARSCGAHFARSSARRSVRIRAPTAFRSDSTAIDGWGSAA